MPDAPPDAAPAQGVLAEAIRTGNFSRIELAKGLSASAKMVCGVLHRQRCDDIIEEKAVEAGMLPIPDDGNVDVALRTLKEVVEGIHTGADLSSQYHVLNRLLHNQQQRAEVVDSLLLTSEYKRVVEVTTARNHLEAQLVKSAYREDLTPAEQLVLLSQLTQISNSASSKIKAGALPLNDLTVLLQKIDYAANAEGEAALKKTYVQTSPQAREVIRKLALRLIRVVKDVPAAEQAQPATDLP